MWTDWMDTWGILCPLLLPPSQTSSGLILILLARPGENISIYVVNTKTFICIKYFFLFEPLNFRRVTFMSKIFWKIFHAFFLQGVILFLKISKVIFLSLHFLYPLDLQLRVLSVIMRLDVDRFSSLGCDQTSSWSSLLLSDIIMIHAVFNRGEYWANLGSGHSPGDGAWLAVSPGPD